MLLVKQMTGPIAQDGNCKNSHFFFFQGAARMIKETLDKKFGPAWHVVVGEGFGFEITHEVKNLLYMFFGGTQAILLWKCA